MLIERLRSLHGLPGFLRRKNTPPDENRPLFRPTAPELLLWIVFASVTLLSVLYHEPWRDEAQGFLIVRDNTLPGLVRHMRDESQFILWFLLTWPAVRLASLPIFGVNILHWMLSCTTAFLILRRAPFRFLTRAALIFSVVFAFEYTAVARHYAIGIFLLTILLMNWKHRFRRPILFACGIALCASTNLPVWSSLGGICAAIGFEIIRDRRWTLKNFGAGAVSIFGFLLALAEIYNFHGGFGSQYVARSGNKFFDAPWERLMFAFESISRTAFLPASLCGLCFAAGVLYFARKRLPALVCFLTGSLTMFALQLAGGFHSMRHIGFLLVSAAVSCWICAAEETEQTPDTITKSRLDRNISLLGGFAAAVILVMQVIVWPFFVWNEVKFSFSHGRDTAQYMKKNLRPDAPLYCFTARNNTTVMAYLPDRRFFIFDRNEFGTFSKWGKIIPGDLNAMAFDAAKALPPNHNYAVFLIAENERAPAYPPNMILLYNSREEAPRIWSPYNEAYLVFAVVRSKEITGDEKPGLHRIKIEDLPD